MRIIIGLFTLLSVGALSQAMATDPPAEAPKAATSTSAPSPAAATSTPSTTTDKATSTDGTKTVKLVAGDEAADLRLKKLRAAGYKTEMHGADVVFCRKEPVLGSRFEQKVCHTAQELDELMANGRDLLETTQRSGLGNPKGN